jgi:hypothetical protein
MPAQSVFFSFHRFTIGERKVCSVHNRFLLVITVALMTSAASPQATKYSNTPNEELQGRVLRLVKSIRALVDAYQEKDRKLQSAFDQKNRPDIPMDEKRMVREQWIKESDAIHDSFLREYKENYWADAILLRNELYRRLPRTLQRSQVVAIYQYPTNILGIDAVADNLELLSKSLPEK